jgi:hypothetical protein
VRFAFLVHQVRSNSHDILSHLARKSAILNQSELFLDPVQFARGFDAESMKAFEEVRSKMSTQAKLATIRRGGRHARQSI